MELHTKNYTQWLNSECLDEESKEKLLRLDTDSIKECFYKNLEFGTGGMRGIMGLGTNRMNIFTIAMATTGFSNYLKKHRTNPSVAIAYDSRNNSKRFAEIAANVFSASKIKVYLFDDIRPTPELSFAIRKLGCDGGVVVTASHNPKQYNGYKVYWNDGGQLTSPHDTDVIEEVKKVSNIDQLNMTPKKNLIEIIGKEIDEDYLNMICGLSLNKKMIEHQNQLKIVYSPLHGTGAKLVPEALQRVGFENVHLVKKQSIPDGDFPTVEYPNPEEKEALTLALHQAQKIDADILMATDPDADRIGIAVRDNENNFVLLNGNQTGSLLVYYVLSQMKPIKNGYTVKTIVTTDLIKKISEDFEIKCYETLTGFKYIAELIATKKEEKYIVGGEESYGYLVGDQVRDKDAVSSCVFIAEMTAWAKENGLSLFDLLEKIYEKYGFFWEQLHNIKKEGIVGIEEIKNIMNDLRKNPLTVILDQEILRIKDYKIGTVKDLSQNTTTSTNLPESNVLQFFTKNYKVSIRPSGTEPKIKFYFAINGEVEKESKIDLKNKLEEVKVSFLKELSLN